MPVGVSPRYPTKPLQDQLLRVLLQVVCIHHRIAIMASSLR